MTSDPRIDAYIAAREPFAQPILAWLRARVHAAVPAAEETIKWGMPFFTYRGRPLANMAAFKAHASFGFWNREAVETGKEGQAMGQFGRIAALDDLPDAPAIEGMIREAAALIDAGAPARATKAPKPEVETPAELAEALAREPQAAATFDGFPPGARREYCEWVGEGKRAETRAKRAAEAVVWIAEGKRRNWKYEKS